MQCSGQGIRRKAEGARERKNGRPRSGHAEAPAYLLRRAQIRSSLRRVSASRGLNRLTFTTASVWWVDVQPTRAKRLTSSASKHSGDAAKRRPNEPCSGGRAPRGHAPGELPDECRRRFARDPQSRRPQTVRQTASQRSSVAWPRTTFQKTRARMTSSRIFGNGKRRRR